MNASSLMHLITSYEDPTQSTSFEVESPLMSKAPTQP